MVCLGSRIEGCILIDEAVYPKYTVVAN
jgi:hypothetical protein